MLDDAEIPDLARRSKIHVVGAAGAGMSAIATVLVQMGHGVTGSDAAGGPVLERLRAAGVQVHVGHDPSWVDGADLVAASTAVPAEDPELAEARARGIPVLRRSQILAAICRQKRTIGVSGTHGKTTTASMLAVLLHRAGLRPSMVIGGDIAGVGPGARWESEGEWLVVEADESDGTFLELGCDTVVVTSVGSDHLDYFQTPAGVEAAFRRFVSEAAGSVVLCADDPGAAALVSSVAPPERALTYGLSPHARIRVGEVTLGRFTAGFSISDGGEDRGRVELAVPGLHNVLNAAGAVAAATVAGVGWDEAREAIAGYAGVSRRFQWRGESAEVTFVDDYAHNPDKVAAALAAARDGGWQRIVAVFQPHRYTRTEALWREFGPALAAADVVVVTDIYPAGEKPIPGVDGSMIATAVREASPAVDVRYAPSLDDAERLLREVLRSGDLCLTLGAGDITELAARFVPAEQEGARDG